MIIYTAAFDPYHASYRFFRMRHLSRTKTFHFDALRIIDFLILFPHLLFTKNIKMTAGGVKWRNFYGKTENRYNSVPAPQMLLSQMRGMQDAAVRKLNTLGYLELDGESDNQLRFSDMPTPEDVVSLIEAEPKEFIEYISYMVNNFGSVPALGIDGIKHRTGLLEHRYDPS